MQSSPPSVSKHISALAVSKNMILHKTDSATTIFFILFLPFWLCLARAFQFTSSIKILQTAKMSIFTAKKLHFYAAFLHSCKD